MGTIWSRLRGRLHRSEASEAVSKERTRGRTRTRTPPPTVTTKTKHNSAARETMPSVVRNTVAPNIVIPTITAKSAFPHEFVWKNGGTKVCLTGNFDEWSQSILMTRDQNGIFRATINLNPKQTWYFKFVVDGVWRCSLDFESEMDEHGNVNNVIRAEEK